MDAKALDGTADLYGFPHGFLAQLAYLKAAAGNDSDIPVLGKALERLPHGSAGDTQFLGDFCLGIKHPGCQDVGKDLFL